MPQDLSVLRALDLGCDQQAVSTFNQLITCHEVNGQTFVGTFNLDIVRASKE
jgi:hypothetical protein